MQNREGLDAEEAQERAQVLRAIEGHLPIVVWAIDRKGTFTHHEGNGLAAIGLTPGQHVGMNIFELYAELGETMAPLRRALAGQLEHSSAEVHGIVWDTWQIPVRDARDEVTSVVCISLDVSEARRAEKLLTERLALIERQQSVIRALSAPIIEVWDRVLAIPMLGVVDSGTAAEVMEALLAQISVKQARFAVLDLTGVQVVDTGTAGHLLKLIHAIRLLGAEGILTGIQPAVAQTMITLGLDLTGIVTLARLSDALQFCIERMRT
jgi:rsbT co-antagonist protein RsbR